jgi:ATP-dependent Clp protease ATP-binding subunit ClpA
MSEMLEPLCIRALMHAQNESRKLHVNWVCGVQILLGISQVRGTDIAAAVVLSGFKPHEVRLELEKVLAGRKEMVGDVIPYTETAKTIMRLAKQKAQMRSVIPQVTLLDLLLAVLENPGELLVDSVISSGTHWGTFREELRKRVQTTVPPKDGFFVNCQFLGRELDGNSQEVLQIARTELQSDHSKELGTEHILLGIFQVDTGIRQILNEAGILLPIIRQNIKDMRKARIEQNLAEGIEDLTSTEVESICNIASVKAKEDATPVRPLHMMLAILSGKCLALDVLNLASPQIEMLVAQLKKTQVKPVVEQ